MHGKQGRGLQPDELALDRTGIINKTVASVLAGKYPHGKISSCSMFDTYDETPIFIILYITEDVVESVARKLSGSSGPEGTYS